MIFSTSMHIRECCLMMNLIQRAIDAIESGSTGGGLEDYLPQLRKIQLSIDCKTSNGEREFQELLAANPSLANALTEHLADEVLAFVSSEFERFRQIKSIRSLTDDERAYGNKVLRSLLESTLMLFGKHNGNEGGHRLS